MTAKEYLNQAKTLCRNANANTNTDKLIEIKQRIERVYNRDYISLLTNMYMYGRTLEQTAEIMGKSYTTICHWHKEALDIFRKENYME